MAAQNTNRGDQPRVAAKSIDRPMSKVNIGYRVRPVMRIGGQRAGRKVRRS